MGSFGVWPGEGGHACLSFCLRSSIVGIFRRTFVEHTRCDAAHMPGDCRWVEAQLWKARPPKPQQWNHSRKMSKALRLSYFESFRCCRWRFRPGRLEIFAHNFEHPKINLGFASCHSEGLGLGQLGWCFHFCSWLSTEYNDFMIYTMAERTEGFGKVLEQFLFHIFWRRHLTKILHRFDLLLLEGACGLPREHDGRFCWSS